MKSSSDLRDWFAGMALTSFVVQREADKTPAGMAAAAYIVADEMIKARDLSREELDAIVSEVLSESDSESDSESELDSESS